MTEASTPVGEAGQSQKLGLFLLGRAFRLKIRSLPWPIAQVFGPAHELRAIYLGRAFVGKLVREGPWVYEPDRSPRAPGRFG